MYVDCRMCELARSMFEPSTVVALLNRYSEFFFIVWWTSIAWHMILDLHRFCIHSARSNVSGERTHRRRMHFAFSTRTSFLLQNEILLKANFNQYPLFFISFYTNIEVHPTNISEAHFLQQYSTFQFPPPSCARHIRHLIRSRLSTLKPRMYFRLIMKNRETVHDPSDMNRSVLWWAYTHTSYAYYMFHIHRPSQRERIIGRRKNKQIAITPEIFHQRLL